MVELGVFEGFTKSSMPSKSTSSNGSQMLPVKAHRTLDEYCPPSRGHYPKPLSISPNNAFLTWISTSANSSVFPTRTSPRAILAACSSRLERKTRRLSLSTCTPSRGNLPCLNSHTKQACTLTRIIQVSAPPTDHHTKKVSNADHHSTNFNNLIAPKALTARTATITTAHPPNFAYLMAQMVPRTTSPTTCNAPITTWPAAPTPPSRAPNPNPTNNTHSNNNNQPPQTPPKSSKSRSSSAPTASSSASPSPSPTTTSQAKCGSVGC